jgi:hypothetical protein
MRPLLLALALVLATACHSSAPAAPDGASAAPTISLRAAPYVQPPGESYHCWWFRPDTAEGTAITAFHPVTSAGVHHLALFYQAGGTVQADRECDSFGQWSLVWGAGVGTGDAQFPDGVAVPARADGVYILQVHLLNASDQPAAIEAGVDLTLAPAGTPYTRAGMLIEGNTSFTVPAHTQGFAVDTDCTGQLPDGAQLVGLFPHMHRLGARFQADVRGASVYDQAWKFDAQTLAMFAPFPTVARTDTLHMRCTYDNTSDTAVSFGLSTTDEMCFGAFYYAPATRDEIDCIQ